MEVSQRQRSMSMILYFSSSKSSFFMQPWQKFWHPSDLAWQHCKLWNALTGIFVVLFLALVLTSLTIQSKFSFLELSKIGVAGLFWFHMMFSYSKPLHQMSCFPQQPWWWWCITDTGGYSSTDQGISSQRPLGRMGHWCQYCRKCHQIPISTIVTTEITIMQPFTDYFPCADIHQLLASNILHQLIQGAFKDHLVEWVGKYLKSEYGKAGTKERLADIDRQ